MEVSTDSQNSIVFEGSSQEPSNSGIVFTARRSSIDSVGTGNQGRPRKSLRSSTSSSRSSRAPYKASQRSMRRSASSSSLGSMAGKDGDRVDEEQSEPSEQSNALSGNLAMRTAINKVIPRYCISVFCVGALSNNSHEHLFL